ncbi:mitochondrial ribosomal protein of the large subunit [Nadsonia fulvescens var. elongata DSM 6958]|uniref:Mitochondrial ribosomal protein of the large subunit n=1 Tax=Nadsonia fulvescens var. elongata DSM 6958 TaxID=857566 RepID=A0A1E3PLP4_9ASCO|nr:mitochondrial ribosomal protein of the large subunit [Nadsonia fulvescens var. elongata DSM 6958]
MFRLQISRLNTAFIGAFGTTSSRLARFNSTTAAGVVEAVHRDTLKAVDSRKTYLVDRYSHLLQNSPILLILHHNNLPMADNQKIRSELAPLGVTLSIVKSSLFKVALRGEGHTDPASKSANEEFKKVTHPLSPLLVGPTAIISVPEMNPETVKKVTAIIERSKDRLVLMGARVESEVMTKAQIDQFKNLPTLDALRSQLVGVLSILGGAGLVQTLESVGQNLFLTLQSRAKDMEPKENPTEEVEQK